MYVKSIITIEQTEIASRVPLIVYLQSERASVMSKDYSMLIESFYLRSQMELLESQNRMMMITFVAISKTKSCLFTLRINTQQISSKNIKVFKIFTENLYQFYCF